MVAGGYELVELTELLAGGAEGADVDEPWYSSETLEAQKLGLSLVHRGRICSRCLGQLPKSEGFGKL